MSDGPTVEPEVVLVDGLIKECVTQADLLTRAKNKWTDACIERDAALEKITRLRAELAASAEALERAASCASANWNIDERIDCTAAATRAREASVTPSLAPPRQPLAPTED